MITHARLCVLGYAVLVAVLVSVNGAQLPAQQFQPGQQTPQDIFLLAPRALQRLLSEGRTAIAEGRFSDGVDALGAILQDDNEDIQADLRGQDFFLRPGTGESIQSIKNRAIEELNQLPEEGRRTLEIQFGVKARQLLDQALAKQDIEQVSTVARRFVHTEAGYDAMLLVAQYKMTTGSPLTAASILRTLLNYPMARKRFGVELAQTAAVCWLQSGNRSRAVATLERAGKDFAGSSLTIRGQQIAIDNIDAIIKALEADSIERNLDRSVKSWLVTGGSAARNATSDIGMPLPNVHWSYWIHSSRPEGMALLEAEETERKNGRLLLPRIELRMVGDTVISRSNDSNIIGIDIDTGLFKWQRPTSGSAAPLKEPAWNTGDNQLSTELKNRIWGSNSFGRITCDSQRCYYVVQKQSDMEEVRALGMGARYASTTRLEALSIAGEGAIIWSLGGVDSVEPTLAGAFFLGPPLPYGGQLYTLVEINGQTELVVLDPASGKLLWRQQLSATQLQIEFDQARQSQGLTPSIADGIIVCPTGSGGLVAMDLMSRSLRWGVTYGMVNAFRNLQFGGGAFGGTEYDPLNSRWFDESLVIENGFVVVTPPESELLFCLDLLTGEELIRRPRAGASYVAGIYGKSVVLVNGRSVQALDLQVALDQRHANDMKKGQTPETRPAIRPRQGDPRAMANNVRTRWDTQFPEGQTLVGRGIWRDGSMLLPLTNGRIIEIDLETGKITNSCTVSTNLGNLFAHDNILFSVGPTDVTAFYTRKHLESSVESRLAKNPKDTWGLNHKAQLLLADKKTVEAFQLLLASYEINPQDYETRDYLVDAMLVGLQEDFANFSKYAAQLDSVVQPETPYRVKYLQLLAKGLIDQGDHVGAIKRLWDIMSERRMALIQGAQTRNAPMQVEPLRAVDLDTWFAVELGRLYEKCSPQQKDEVRSWVVDAFSKLKSTVVTVRRQVLRHMLQLPAAEQENLDLATTLLEITDHSGVDQRRNEQTSAEQILTTLMGSSNADIRKKATELMAKVPESDVGIPDLGDAKDGPWPSGLLTRQVDDSDDGIYSLGKPIEMIGNRFGRPPFNIANSDRLVFTDINGKTISHLGYRHATSDLGGSYMRAEVRGGLILLETTSEIVAIDFYHRRDTNQAILWRYSLDNASPREQFQQPRNMDATTGLLGIPRVARIKTDDRPYVEVGPLMMGAKIVQNGGSIIGLDPYSGRKLWSRDGYGSDVEFAGASDSNTLVVVNPAKSKTELIDARDGKVIGQNNFLVEEMGSRFKDRTKQKWERWYSYENWMVDYLDNGESQVRLRVWNPLEEKILLDTLLPSTARVTQSQRSQLAIVVPTGQLQLVDLESGQISKFDVPVDAELEKVSMLQFGDRMVILNNASAVPGRQLLNASDLPASGYIYCVNAKTKQMEWSEPGRMFNMAVPQIQPRNSPYLVASRLNQGSTTTTVLLLDLRTGKIAYSIDGPKLDRPTMLSIELRPQSHEIALMIGEKFFRFRATDEPAPPEPIINFGFTIQREVPIKRDSTGLFDQ